MFQRKLVVLAITSLVYIVCPWSIRAQQTVEVDWATKLPTSPAITVNKVTPIKVVVTNVNDLLYTYHGRLASTGTIVPLPTNLPSFPGGEQPELTDDCKTLTEQLTALDTAFGKTELSPLQTGTAVPHSVSLSATIAAYKDARAKIEAFNTVCSDAGLVAKKTNYQRLELQWDTALSTSHAFAFNATLEPTTNYSILITEEFRGTTTDACTTTSGGKTTGTDCAITYTPSSTIITNSEGFLLTTLPGRTYGRGVSPAASGPVLTVNNAGPAQAALVALVNVKIPWICPQNDDSWGCSVSVGPAYQFSNGGQSASRLGLFAGISVHLWRYLYLTPGAHFAQYDAFPLGFTAAGQAIPPTLTGDLTPVKKTTIAFAFGLTFKAWDILKSQQSQATVAPAK